MRTLKNPKKTIYTFWEPKENLIPYLALCRKTWEVNLPEYEIITLDYSNFKEYIDGDALDFTILKKLPLPMQKDAFMVAVLQQNGGIFIDLDTIVFDDIAPILDKLKQTEVLMFNTHCGFVASQPDSMFMVRYLREINKRLSLLGENHEYENLGWDYLANDALIAVMDEIINTSLVGKFFPVGFFHLLSKIFNEESNHRNLKLQQSLEHFTQSLLSKRRIALFKLFFKSYLRMLDRRRYGFIQEAVYFRNHKISSIEKYLRFWFKTNVDMSGVRLNEPIIVGLHNSWTPDWYKELSVAEVQKYDCHLSRVLNFVLEGKL